jgi:hypothetical protein
MTTLLNQLPSDPAVPRKENIIMETPSYKNDLDITKNLPAPLNQNDLSSMVGQVEQAAQQGLTKLGPEITQNTMHITNDPQVTANHIPAPPPPPQGQPQDYIPNYVIEDTTKQQENKLNTSDIIFNEIKIPLVVALIYIVFQLPAFKSMLLKACPFLYKSDANFNLNGYVMTSILFAVVYYVSLKLFDHFSI